MRNERIVKMVTGDFILGFGPLKGLKPIDCDEAYHLHGLTYYLEKGFHNDFQMKGINQAFKRLQRSQAQKRDYLRRRFTSLVMETAP